MNLKEFGVSVKLLNCSADTRRSYMVLHYRPTTGPSTYYITV